VARRIVGRQAGDGLIKRALRDRAANSNPANLMRRYWEAHDLIGKAMSTPTARSVGGEFSTTAMSHLAAPAAASHSPGVDDRLASKPVDGGRTRPCRRHFAVLVCGWSMSRLIASGRGTRLDRWPRPASLWPRWSALGRLARRAGDEPTSPPTMFAPRRSWVSRSQSTGLQLARATSRCSKRWQRGGFVRTGTGSRRPDHRVDRAMIESGHLLCRVAGRRVQSNQGPPRQRRRLRQPADVRTGRVPGPRGHGRQHQSLRQRSTAAPARAHPQPKTAVAADSRRMALEEYAANAIS